MLVPKHPLTLSDWGNAWLGFFSQALDTQMG